MNLVDLYYGFREKLSTEPLRRKLCRLSLDARNEMWLTGELFDHVLECFDGAEDRVSVFQNLGRGPRRDLVLASGSRITHVIECKLVKNRHRASPFFARDDVGTQIADLASQLRWSADERKKGLADFDLRTSGRGGKPYGFLVASYSGIPGHADAKLAYHEAGAKQFFRTSQDLLDRHNIRFEDKKHAQLEGLIDGHEVTYGGHLWKVTLKTSLCVTK
jgi:hypothetical protein